MCSGPALLHIYYPYVVSSSETAKWRACSGPARPGFLALVAAACSPPLLAHACSVGEARPCRLAARGLLARRFRRVATRQRSPLALRPQWTRSLQLVVASKLCYLASGETSTPVWAAIVGFQGWRHFAGPAPPGLPALLATARASSSAQICFSATVGPRTSPEMSAPLKSYLTHRPIQPLRASPVHASTFPALLPSPSLSSSATARTSCWTRWSPRRRPSPSCRPAWCSAAL